MTPELLIFTRYPEPGKTKTRLIPALGTHGAAQLHRQMGLYTLRQAEELILQEDGTIQVWFTGGTTAAMQNWLGDRWAYHKQFGSELGERISNALSSHFHRSDRPALVMGTDCPGLTTALLSQACKHLNHYDLVLGPALDGGYYLIGVKRWIPNLFMGITWGSESVLEQTLEIAQALHLNWICLPVLPDIDRPEDLGFLKDYAQLACHLKPNLSKPV